MIPDRLFLVGFLGAPKLAVGQALARRLRRPLFDTDDVVETAAKMATHEIYRKEGEGGFRQRERRALVGVATGPPAIIVTGANLFVDRGNRRTMQQSGISIYIDASLDECLENAIAEQLIRADEESSERFATLFDLRRPDYERCDVAIDTRGRDPEALADEIIQRLEDRVWSENA